MTESITDGVAVNAGVDTVSKPRARKTTSAGRCSPQKPTRVWVNAARLRPRGEMRLVDEVSATEIPPYRIPSRPGARASKMLGGIRKFQAIMSRIAAGFPPNIEAVICLGKPPWSGLIHSDVRLQSVVHARFGYIQIQRSKSKNAKRNLSLTVRAAKMLRRRKPR